MSKYEEFIDKMFGKLKVIKYVGQSQSNSPLFECKCECGKTTYAVSTQLRNGQKKSCGCLKKKHHFEYKQKIADLEAKLAEKDKEIEWLKIKLEKANTERHEEWKTGKEWKWAWQKANRQLEQANQDKISFAVEQLNFVRESLLENLYDLYSKPSEIWEEYGDLYDVVITGGINKTIDNQIKKLKEGK